MLLLFDVDATLLTTGRAGVRAIGRAGRRLFDPEFDEDHATYAGRLDPLILHDVLELNGIEPTAEAMATLKAGYAEDLSTILTEPDADGPGSGDVGLCPGVGDLLEAVRAEAWSEGDPDRRFVTGLLTGNYEQTGRIKLGACGLDADDFTVRVWGTDSPEHPPSRDQLTAVGIDRCRDITGREHTGHEVIVIGDTVHDIQCAHAHGCRCIGVATGGYTTGDLAHADLTLEDLTDTGRIMEWISSS